MFDLLIKNAVIVNDDEQFMGAVAVKDEKIAAIMSSNILPEAKKIIDASGLYLLPGGVDAHVHIRYPGSAHRETFTSGTMAAAAGGTTTIIEHPISTPPQYSPEILKKRIDAFETQGIVDAAFLGAAGGDRTEEILRIAKAGIVGFKTFLHAAPEGREKEFEGLCCTDSYQLSCALKEASKTGLPFAAHTEDNDLVTGNIEELKKAGKTFPLAHCMSRPPITEVLAVQRLLTLAKEQGTAVYLVHISTPQAVELALDAKAKGQKVYIETCPQYLYMDESWVEKHGAYAKCNPALRSHELVQQMWKYIKDGSIDVVSSDHAPYTTSEKESGKKDIFAAPSGFPGIETRGPFIFKAVKDNIISLQRAVALLSSNPAKIFNLKGKGRIAIGYDADFVLCNPYREFCIAADDMFTQAKEICHFMDGTVVSGKAQIVILRGNIIFEQGKIEAKPGSGRWVSSAAATNMR